MLARMVVRTHRKLRFAGDSPLEESGFEPLVPLRDSSRRSSTASTGRLAMRLCRLVSRAREKRGGVVGTKRRPGLLAFLALSNPLLR